MHEDYTVGFHFQDAEQFDMYLDIQCDKDKDIAKRVKNIEGAIKYALQHSDEEVQIEITSDSAQIDQDMYARILKKFYALMRYQLYQSIKRYWNTN